MEQWRAIPGMPGYEVSDRGRVRSLKKWRGESGRILDGFFNNGYSAVNLTPPVGRARPYQIHPLVLKAFVGPRPEGHQACHRNSIKTDNRLDNLYWGTPAQNEADKIAIGKANRGERHGMSKLTDEQVQEILAAIPTWKRGMAAEFGRKFGVNRSLISEIKNRKKWKHL